MKTKILLVDDEKDIVEFLQYNLIQEGFEVITAYNGMEALKMLSEKPDLVILDIMMPQLNGYDVCKKIRSLPEFRQTPVTVSYTHLRAHETVLDLVCRLLLE